MNRKRLLFLTFWILFFGFLDARADAVSCQESFPIACPFDYSVTGRPPVIQLKDFNCASDPIGPNPVPDSLCWQQALSCAFQQPDGRQVRTFAIEATEGITYQIDQTLCLVSTSDALPAGPIINGNDAVLLWTGPYDPLSPMFYFGGMRQGLIEKLQIKSHPGQPMHSAMVFGSPQSGVSSTNTVRNVIIEGTNILGLDYGIRLAGAESFSGNPLGLRNVMNDLFTFQDVNIFNVMKAGISIEHSQAFSNRLIGVEIYAAPNDELYASDDCMDTQRDATWTCLQPIMGGSGVRLLAGSFDSFGGFIHGFGNAAYFLAGIESAVTIVDHHSEWCGSLLRTQDGWTGYGGTPVTVLGGRFATEGINAEGRIIDWRRGGPLRIDGLFVSGVPTAVRPRFYLHPNLAPGFTAEVEISHLHVYVNGSAAWPDLFEVVNGDRLHLVSVGNICAAEVGQGAPCPGLGGGTDQAVAVMTNKDLTSSSNLFPATLTADADWDSVLEINAHTVDGDFATLAGPEALANKDLSSDTNWTAPTGTVPFVSTLPKSMTTAQFCPPYSGLCNSVESSVSTSHPALRPRSLYCKVSTAPGTGKSWTFKARAAGSDLLACKIEGTAKTCQIVAGAPPSAPSRWAEGAAVSLKVEPVGLTLPSTSATCVLGVGP